MKTASTPVNILNSLVSINAKRFERYKTAADHVKDINGKLLFMNYAVQSQEFIGKLNKWILAYGPASNSIRVVVGNNIFTKSWSGLRQVLFLGGKKFLIGHCEFIERESLRIYGMALAEPALPQATISDIKKQNEELKEAYSALKTLREGNLHDVQAAS